MAIVRPLKMVGDELIEMSDADLAYVRYVLANDWASGENTGAMRINSAPSGWFSVGSAVDTRRSKGFVSINVTGNQSAPDGNPDAEPGYSISSLSLGTTNTTYTFYQNNNGNSSTPSAATLTANAVAITADSVVAYQAYKYDATSSYDTIIDDTIQDIEAGTVPGRYYIGTSAPDSTYVTTGYSMTDTRQTVGSTNDSPVTVNTYTLYRKTSSTIPSVVRPLRFESGGDSTSSAHLIEMTDAEIIATWGPYLKNRTFEGSRLQYTMSTSTTGINCGSVSDTSYQSSTTTTPASKIYTRTISGSTSVINTYYLRLTNT